MQESHVKESPHMKESRHICNDHMWESHHIWTFVTSWAATTTIGESRHIWKSHVTYERVTAYEGVTSHLQESHVNESLHMNICHVLCSDYDDRTPLHLAACDEQMSSHMNRCHHIWTYVITYEQMSHAASRSVWHMFICDDICSYVMTLHVTSVHMWWLCTWHLFICDDSACPSCTATTTIGRRCILQRATATLQC